MAGGVKFVVTGDVSHVEKALHKMQRQVESLKGQLKAAGKKGKEGAETAGKGFNKLGTATKKALDPAVLLSYAAGFVGVQAAIGKVTEALKAMHEERKRGAQLMRESATGLASLAQLAGGDAGKLRGLIEKAKEVRKAGGAPTLTEAANLVFQLESAGAIQERGFFGKLQTVTPATEAAGAAAKIQAAMGFKETGKLQDILSGAAAAAAPVTGAGIGDILGAATKPAKIAHTMGISDEELFAAISIVAKGTETADVAGTQVQSFLVSMMQKPEYKGLSIQQMVEKVQKKALPEAELKKFFGRKEAALGFLALEGGEFPGMTKAITEAKETNLIGKIVGSAMAIPAIQAVRGQVALEGQEEVVDIEKFGLKQIEREKALSRTRIKSKEAEESGAKRYVRGKVGGAAEFLGAEPEVVESAGGALTDVLWGIVKTGLKGAEYADPGTWILKEILKVLQSTNKKTAPGPTLPKDQIPQAGAGGEW